MNHDDNDNGGDDNGGDGDGGDIVPTREQELAIQKYCRQKLRLVRLADTDGIEIRDKRRKMCSERKALVALITTHTDYPVADVDDEHRVYSFLTPENDKMYVKLGKTASQRAVTLEVIEAAIRDISGADVVSLCIDVLAKKQKKPAASMTNVPMRDAVAQSLLKLIRERTRRTNFKADITAARPRGWAKTDPPVLPAGWAAPVETICRIQSELAVVEPVFKRRRTEIATETAKHAEVVQEFFQRLPERERVQPVMLKPADNDTGGGNNHGVSKSVVVDGGDDGGADGDVSVSTTDSSGSLQIGEQLQYLSMTTRRAPAARASTSVKLTSVKAQPVLQKAIDRLFGENDVFSVAAFDAWHNVAANVDEFASIVTDEISQIKTADAIAGAAAPPKHALKLSITLKNKSRAYKAGDDDDDDDDNDGDDDDNDDNDNDDGNDGE